MAALLKSPAKSGKPAKGVRGRMPTKRSINLVLVEEDRISIPKAVLGIILIIGLAYLFGRYLVYDRLIAVSEASARVNRLQTNLNEAMELVNSFGDVETKYAHYTMDGMTQAELALVDRVDVLELVGTILPEQPEVVEDELDELDEFDELYDDDDEEDLLEDEAEDDQGSAIKSWNASENVLTIEVGGPSLEALNQLAHQLEGSPIVNSCTITTANKATPQQRAGGQVWAKLIVYLQQPVEEVSAP